MKLRRTLVVESADESALMFRKRLERLGHEVISISDCSEATLSSCISLQPGIMFLKISNEHEATTLADAERVTRVLDIPIILLAEFRNARNTETSLKRPTVGFLLNPCNDLELGATVELELHRHHVRADAVLEVGPRYAASEPEPEFVAPKGEDKALDFIKKVAPFSDIPEPALRELVRRSHFSTVKSGSYIEFEGDESESSFIVVLGRIALTKTTASGKDLIVELLGPEEFSPLVLAMDALPLQLTARAQSLVTVLWIPTPALVRVLDDYPELYRGFLSHLSVSLRSSYELSRMLAYESVETRIAALFLHLATKFARHRLNSEVPIMLDITRQQIAELTGTTPETAIRITRMMHRQGIIGIGAPGVIRIIDIPRLIAIVDS